MYSNASRNVCMPSAFLKWLLLTVIYSKNAHHCNYNNEYDYEPNLDSNFSSSHSTDILKISGRLYVLITRYLDIKFDTSFYRRGYENGYFVHG